MEQIEMLEMELTLMLENIKRMKLEMSENGDYYQRGLLVVGELKHRSISLKQRLTIIQKMSTNDFIPVKLC